jgi:hypothetical protein
MRNKMPKLVETLLTEFRIADRELFNKHFRVEEPWENQDAAWILLERFHDLETILFQKMVPDALSITAHPYGEPQENILLNSEKPISALINREINSGYWDFPLTEIPSKSELRFISYFDWDAISIRDNRYIRIEIYSCPLNPALTGKNALVDALAASYCLREN